MKTVLLSRRLLHSRVYKSKETAAYKDSSRKDRKMGIAESKTVTLKLVPETKVPGFLSGIPLTLVAKTGDTVGTIIDRFNTYRGPDAQITKLYTPEGEPLEFSTIIYGNMVAVIR